MLNWMTAGAFALALAAAGCAGGPAGDGAAAPAGAEQEPPGPSTVRGVNHIAVTVTDLDRALAIYEGAVGLRLEDRRPLTGAAALAEVAGRSRLTGEVAVLSGPNVRIHLVSYAPAVRATAAVMPVNGPGYTHICFQGRNDASFYRDVLAAGATPVTRGGEPVNLANTGYLYMYNRDPDGVMFEIEEALKPRFSERMWVSHVAHASPDLDRLSAFYTAVFGVAPHNRLAGLKGPTFDKTSGLDGVVVAGSWINLANITLEFWQYDSPKTTAATAPRPVTAPGYSHVMYEVGDLGNEMRRVSAAGGVIASKVEVAGGRRTVFARDVDGNLFGLVETPAGDPASMAGLKAADR